MYCNSCMSIIGKDDITYCEQCGVPLHKSCANKCLDCGKVLCDTCFAENNYKCEECYKPANMFTKIRRSHIEQYAGCPYSLYLQLILGKEPPMGSHAQLGIIVHQIIDQMSEHDITLQEAQDKLLTEVNTWNASTTDDYSIVTDELIEVGRTCLNNFFLIRNEFKKPYESEVNIIYSINPALPKISCTLDRVNRNDSEIHLHDWKTGKPMSGQKLITDLQPPLYIWAIFMEHGVLPKTFTLHYLQYDKHMTYRLIDEEKALYEITTARSKYVLDVHDALKRTEEILTGIVNNQFNMPSEKTHSWRCKSFCWFGINGQCQGSADEQWKVLNNKYGKKEE